jgi:predicted Fe-Mo cluster-binding NifX family protein
MKIAVSAVGRSLDAEVDPRFGRCPYFLIVETADLSFEAVPNASVSLGGGAGIQSAQLMAEKAVEVVLTGNCGPNAYRTLEAAGIKVVTGYAGTARQAVDSFRSGAWSAIEQPNVDSHFGVGWRPGP